METSHALDYSQKSLSNGHYRFTKLLPTNGQQSIVLAGAGTTESVFEIPSKVFNPSKTFLRGSILVPQQVANVANSSIKLHKYGHTFIDSISVSTRSGVFITNLRHAGRWSRASLQAYSSYEDYSTRPIGYVDETVPDAYTSNMFSASHSSVSVPVALGQASIYPDAEGVALVANPGGNDPFMLDLITATLIGHNAGPIALNFKIPFSDFKDTFLATNKDLFFNEVLVLTINWSAKTRVGFSNASATVADNTGFGNLSAANVALSGAVALSNIAVNLAVETNPVVEQEVRNKVMSSGLSMLIPYVNTFRITAGANPTGSITQRLNRGHGRSLLRVISTCVSETEASSSLDWNASNKDGFRVGQFYTTMNSNKLQESTIYATNDDDYVLLEDLIKGSAYINAVSFKNNAIWIDNWHGEKSHLWSDSKTDDDWKAGGVPLEEEQVWGLVADVKQAGVDNPWYVFAITQKLLTINSAGIECN